MVAGSVVGTTRVGMEAGDMAARRRRRTTRGVGAARRRSRWAVATTRERTVNRCTANRWAADLAAPRWMAVGKRRGAGEPMASGFGGPPMDGGRKVYGRRIWRAPDGRWRVAG